MKYNITVLKNIGRLLTASLVYLIVFFISLTIFEKEITHPLYLLGIPLILIYYLIIERYCYQSFLYILFHAVLFVPVCIMPFPIVCYKYLYLGMLVLENIHAVFIWKRNIEKPYKEAPWALFVIITLIYIVTLLYQQTKLSHLVYYCGIGLLLLHFIRLSLEGLGNMLSQSEHATSVPVKKIILTNSFMTGFIILAFLVVTITAYNFQLQKSFYYLGEYIIRIFQVLIHFIFYLISLLRALFSVESQIEQPYPASDQLETALDAVNEPSLLAKVLDSLFTLAALMFALYLLYRIASYFIKLFINRYAKDSDIIVFLHDTREKTENKQERTSIAEKVKFFFHIDNAAKIRRAYKLKIKSYREKIYKKNDTPKDIAHKVLKTYGEDISELTLVYEKARYSNEEITFEDVKKGGIL